MKSLNQIAGLIIVLFLIFNFSNFKSVDDVVNLLSTTNKPIAESHIEGREKAVVHSVVDGDTLKVEFNKGNIETVRLLLVDTPETVKPNTPEQPFGKEASNYLKKELIKDTVIELEKGVQERDRYGRLLAYVWKNGRNINQELLEHGLGRVAYVQEPNTKYLEDFKKAEQKAKEKGIGIWSIDGYVKQNGFNYP